MEWIVFGNENAVMDPLLKDCYVEPKEGSNKSILIGRWGIGKSAILFHNNQKLSDELAKKDEKDRFLWYIGENSLDLASLRGLQSKFNTDQEGFKRTLETFWKTKIICTEAVLLYKLRECYGSNATGEHWDFIAKFGKAKRTFFPVWRQIPDIIGMFVGTDKGRVGAFKNVQDVLEKHIHNKALDYIQACLRDIKDYELQPAVVIEPIDTPNSGLGKEGGLAQTVITALLNVHYTTFSPSQDQLIQLRVSIPWHRFRPEYLDYPQRFFSNLGYIKWNSESLRHFINRRIEWEFKRVGRSFRRDVDVWPMLFTENVTNDHCEPKIFENSFLYFLRHTHYRPRDLQCLARRAVEKYASVSGVTVDKVLLGREGKIPGSTIRETLRESCPLLMEFSFMPEVKRKYSSVVTI